MCERTDRGVGRGGGDVACFFNDTCVYERLSVIENKSINPVRCYDNGYGLNVYHGSLHVLS